MKSWCSIFIGISKTYKNICLFKKKKLFEDQELKAEIDQIDKFYIFF